MSPSLSQRVVEDARGSFVERYTPPEFLHAGITDVFVQDNYPRPRPNVLGPILGS
jgi:dTDP-4-dehydrorhamnose 3,5-epimerase-like enzyme